MSNPSTVYANIFVDELIRAGLKHVCFVPGSRHTPLILAFARHKDDINIYSHLDERSASFFALGLALALDEPVAMVCTSGTAGANFFPAIIEAHQSRVPLIVLTADRPHELRQSGANQTIDQVKMFGDFVLWFYDAPLPEDNPPDVALRNLRTLAARTYAKANGNRKGVVHINMPFRKPLEPDNAQSSIDLTLTNPSTKMVYSSEPRENFDDYSQLLELMEESPKGLIVCGPMKPYDWLQIGNVSYYTAYPMLADILSNERFGDPDLIVSTYETFLPLVEIDEPDIVIQVGDMPISKNIQTYLQKINPKYRVWISEHGDWSNADHNTTHFFHARIQDIAFSLVHNFKDRIERSDEYFIDNVDLDWSKRIKEFERVTSLTLVSELTKGEFFDGVIVYETVKNLPKDSTLFLGNSLPVRLADQFSLLKSDRINIYANRGASGIDGNISTALGSGAARPDKPLVAILGDITFYHDMNGLLAVHRCGVPITIVLLNNDGGGIFHRLPISKHDPDFTDYFVTAHGLDYSHSAKLYGLEYVRADTRDAFRQAFTESVTNRTSTIIEVRTDAQADLKRRNEIVAAVHARLKELNL